MLVGSFHKDCPKANDRWRSPLPNHHPHAIPYGCERRMAASPRAMAQGAQLTCGGDYFGLGTEGTLVLGRVRVLGLEDCLLVEHQGVQEGLLH